MGRATITAKLFDEDDKPVSGRKVSLQIFHGARNGWLAIATAETDAAGQLRIALDNALILPEQAVPAMRLVESGSPAPRVLGAPCAMRTLLSGRMRVLEADFGEIELLGDAAYARQVSSPALASGAGSVAGVPRKPGTSQTRTMRTLDRNVALREAVAGRAIPASGLVVNADTSAPDRIGSLTVSDAASVAATPTVAIGTASIEADQFRAILLQKDSLISSRDQLISTRTAELAQATSRAETLEAQLGTVTDRAEAAESEVARIKAAQAEPAEVTKVIGGLGTKLAEANEALQGSALPFRLGAVKIDLRGRMTNDGAGIVLGEAARDGSGLSAELFIDRPVPKAGSDGIAVPDCGGLTRAAAQRVLRSVGFRLRGAEQRLAPGKGTPGQALMQHPAAGASAPHGSEILVVFGVAAPKDP